MENYYFVMYDLKDNIIAYFDNIKELYDFLNLKSPFKLFRFRWRDRYFHYVQYKDNYYVCYKFTDDLNLSSNDDL